MSSQLDRFQALAEPNRLKIMEMLATRGRLSSSDIANTFKVSAPAVSQHLKVLREARLVKVEKQAQQRIYRINADSLQEIEGWARRMREVWEERFLKLDILLSNEKE